MAQSTHVKSVDFNELVFEDRNKSYGAYVLRKKYADNVLISLLIGVVVVGIIVAIPYISKFISSLNPQEEEVVVPIDWSKMAPPPVDEKKEEILPPPEEKIEPPKEVAASVEFKTLQMTDEPVQEITTTEDLKAANPGAVTAEGTGGSLLAIPGEGDGGSAVVEETKEQIFTIVEKMPEFPGGEVALAKYLQQNIVYPERAKQMNIEGKVYLSFLIDEYGNVSNVEKKRGIGGGCDEEAIRVVKKMPRWNAGKQGGRPVKVQFNLPIEFKLN